MENARTEAARDHDDSTLIDTAEAAPTQQDVSGGELARDVASQAEADAIDDPEGRERVTKQDEIDHAAAVRPDRARGAG
jgi:hypothetical protein